MTPIMAFEGIYTPVVTPYDDDGRVVWGALERVIDHLVDSGVQGLISGGSTGENYTQTVEERLELARFTKDKLDGRLPLIVGTGTMRTPDSIALAEGGAGMGADALLVATPPYAVPTERENALNVLTIDRAADLPIMLYNYPATANVDLTPPIVARLSTLKGVDYIKESTMDVTRVRDIIDLCGDRMTVFGGIMGFESFVNGAEGWVAVGSNILPRDCARLFTLTADAQDYDAARALYARILPVIRLVGGHRYVSATKKALELMGLPTGAPRSPRLPLPEADMPELLAALKAVDLLEKAEA